MKMRTLIVHSVIALSLFTFSCQSSKSNQTQEEKAAEDYQVKTVDYHGVTTNQSYYARIEGQTNVDILPKITGYIQKIYVDEGQYVKKGQALFRIETQTLAQDADAAKSAVDAAQLEVDRLIPLVDKKVVSEVQLETAKANLQQAKSNYNSIVANIGYSNINSPVNGVIGSLPYKEGSLVSSSSTTPLTQVSDISQIYVYFYMNEKEYLDFNTKHTGSNLNEKIAQLDSVSLTLSNDSVYAYKGKVEIVNGVIDENTGNIEWRAIFPNPDLLLRSGGSGKVLLPTQINDVFVIPQQAVTEMQDKKLVYVVNDDQTVSTRVVEVQDDYKDQYYLVKSGLKSGETVVYESVLKLSNGTKINPVKG